MRNVFLNEPSDMPPVSTFEDYTVTSTDPLRIKRDVDTDPLPFTPDTLIAAASLEVDDRVRVENCGGRLIIHGRQQ